MLSRPPARGADLLAIGEVLDLLAGLVRQRGWNYRPNASRTRPRIARQLHPGRSGGIVTTVLTRAGLPSTAVAYGRDGLPGFAARERAAPAPTLTLGAVMALRAAAASECRGETWSTALACADRAAMRLIDLIPPDLDGRNGGAE